MVIMFFLVIVVGYIVNSTRSVLFHVFFSVDKGDMVGRGYISSILDFMVKY